MGAPASRRAWQLHGAVLAALLVVYFAIFWDVLFGPPRGGFNLDGFGAVILFCVLLAYAAVSTVLMFWVGRRVWGPLVMHGLAVGIYAGGIAVESRAERERDAEYARQEAAEQLRRVDRCLQLRELRVIRGEPLRASIELYNGCDREVLLDGVDLTGFPASGGNTFLDEPERGLSRIPSQQAATYVVESMPGAAVPPVDADWGWRGSVDVAVPESRMLCFTSPGAPDARSCASIGRTSIDQR